ncbi:P-loop containing nucleoside triphosphate hydrolase protein [Aspergillus saccharolyticus JOP 1030-1]|uniref:P-loop containing nucleoside triphosphate hydrolase protein n=1 Tax=Aspergillus saccharolyticus JOP 1030-1 TaxID=1450539 RepID=A0A318ZSJ2_9EURO|nr:P-loop containing nucleoside triphosphate hydrolase protein [Aspergillus saccharolyticus JOP 1030-1]PYH47333.1 P-loop containing nucleoside triphosphate hydrolase protein [Aspergillus saccharolyticus JOP 1030-1]
MSIEKREVGAWLPCPVTSSSNLSEIELSTLSPPMVYPFSKQEAKHISWENRGNLVTIVGPVGSGKSTFLKGLASEAPLLAGSLSISHPDIAFCEQTPWLANASIRENIVDDQPPSSIDEDWYRTVVKACSLNLNLRRTPAGDHTLVGSKGARLSGGQRQRIAIARALYSRKRLACFDDVLSSLDNITSRQVLSNTFGPNGLLRQLGCTVFLATHSNYIIVLGNNGEISEQGIYPDLRGRSGGYILKLDLQTRKIDEFKAAHPHVQQEEPMSAAGSVTGPSSPVSDRQLNDKSVCRIYFSSLGWMRIAVFLLLLIVEAAIGGFMYIWVERWSASNDSASGLHLGYWLGVYAALTAVKASALALAIFHLQYTVLRACIKWSEVVIDMTNVEHFSALAQGAITIASLPLISLQLCHCSSCCWVLLQRFYLRTSRQLRLLE